MCRVFNELQEVDIASCSWCGCCQGCVQVSEDGWCASEDGVWVVSVLCASEDGLGPTVCSTFGLGMPEGGDLRGTGGSFMMVV